MKKKNNSEWEITHTDKIGRPVYSKINKINHIPNIGISHHKEDFAENNIPELFLDDDTKVLLDSLYDKHLEPYLVGGKIRDHILGKENKDIDIEIYKVKDINDLIKTLKNTGAEVSSVGKSFGVLKVHYKGKEYDFSLPRRDSLINPDKGHKGIESIVDPDLSIYEASKRRDFTMNALMYSPIDSQIVDPHGGLMDIQESILRAVDHNTFIEDPLRALRGVQFAGRFDMDMDVETIKICQGMNWDNLSKSRIQQEIYKLLTKSQNLQQGLETLKEIKWDGLLPNIKNAHFTQDSVNAINAMRIDNNYKIALISSYLRDSINADDITISRELLLSGKQYKLFQEISFNSLNNKNKFNKMRRVLNTYDISTNILNIIADNDNLNIVESNWDTPPDYTLTGKRLIEMGIPAGKHYNAIINEANDIEDNEEVLTESKIQELIRKHYNEKA